MPLFFGKVYSIQVSFSECFQATTVFMLLQKCTDKKPTCSSLGNLQCTFVCCEHLCPVKHKNNGSGSECHEFGDICL